MQEDPIVTESLPYDPNQLVRFSVKYNNVELPTGPVTGSGEGDSKAESIEMDMEVCQEVARQLGLEALEILPGDELIFTAGEVAHTVGGSGDPIVTPGGDVTDGKTEEIRKGDARVVSSVPMEEAKATAGLGDIKDGLEDLGDRIREALSDLDLEVEYEKTDKGHRVRVKSRPDSSSGAVPTDGDDSGEEEEEIVHQLKRGEKLSISVGTSHTARATAEGDAGAIANNNYIAYINKRNKALFLSELGTVNAVINVGVTLLQLQIGSESD